MLNKRKGSQLSARATYLMMRSQPVQGAVALEVPAAGQPHPFVMM